MRSSSNPGPELSSDQRKDLQSVLDAWTADAKKLEDYGHEHDAAIIRRLCQDIARSASEWLEFLSESNASIKSGRSEAWLRARFKEWETAGHARKRSGHRQYRSIIIPQRDNFRAILSAEERGRISAREAGFRGLSLREVVAAEKKNGPPA